MCPVVFILFKFVATRNNILIFYSVHFKYLFIKQTLLLHEEFPLLWIFFMYKSQWFAHSQHSIHLLLFSNVCMYTHFDTHICIYSELIISCKWLLSKAAVRQFKQWNIKSIILRILFIIQITNSGMIYYTEMVAFYSLIYLKKLY